MGEIFDSLNSLASRQRAHRGRLAQDDADRLHNNITWNAWVLAEGGEHELRNRFVLQRDRGDDALLMRSDEFAAYARGCRALSPPRRELLLKRYPGVGDVLSWPVVALSLRERTLPNVNGWRKQYLNPDIGPDGAYCFPGDPEACSANRRPLWPEDIEGLYERGDAYGFLILICLFRMYHLRREADRQWHTARYMIKALPGMCRDPRVRPVSSEVIRLTRKLLVLLPDSSFRIEMDEELIVQQIDDLCHEPCRAVRLEAERGGQYIPEPREPIVPYKYTKCAYEHAAVMLAGLSSKP